MDYNRRYYNGTNLIGRKGEVSINHYTMKDGTLIGVFQGQRGGMPELDFIVKFLQVGSRSHLRTPSHTHWIVDLLIKYEVNKAVTTGFVKYFRERYDEVNPFQNKEERKKYKLITPKVVEKRFGAIDHKGTYSLEYLATLIELFSLCEKRTDGAFMFRNLLQLMVDYCEGRRDYYQVIGLSKRV